MSKSIKTYLDELIVAVQDFDMYYGLSGRKDYEFREKELRYKKARSNIRNYIIKLQKKAKIGKLNG